MSQNTSSAVMEEWRPIPSFPTYEASSLGRIRKVGRSVRKLMRSKKSGYWQLNLSVNGEISSRKIHVLVCEAFHGLKPAWAELAAHNDGNKDHNTPTNVRWATYAQNSADMVKHGTKLTRENHPRALLTEKDVAEIKERCAGDRKGNGVRRGLRIELAKQYSVGVHVIKDIIGGRSWA